MKQSLNHNWDFRLDYQETYLHCWPQDSQTVHLPHNATLLPTNYFSEESYQGTYTYRRIFDVENYMDNMRYFLHFAGVMVKFNVYLNGEFCGHFAKPYLPVEIEVGHLLKPAGNVLIVVVDGKEDATIPPFGGAADYIGFSGIYRDVFLLACPRAFLKTVHVFGKVNGEIIIKTEIEALTEEVGSLTYRLFNQEGKRLIESKEPNFKIESPHLWSIDDPYLHTLEVELLTRHGSHKKKVRFGFREVAFKKEGFFLNGKKIKLIGLNRHQSYAHIGYGASADLQRHDAYILKRELGLNAVRSSHYPQSPHFLDACDELGLLVVNEVPGWQHISQDLLWRKRHLENVAEMVTRDFNHPSIILNGVRINESGDDHELYAASNEIAHRLDPTRPTTGVRNFYGSELLEDVYAYNDFIHSGNNRGLDQPNRVLKKKAYKNAPYLVTESNGHMFPTKPYDNPLHRLDHVKRHLAVLNALRGNKRIAGGFSWCFVDYQTHADFGSGDHICYHGVYDIYRQPKPAASVYRAELLQEPVLEVISPMDIGDYPASFLGKTMVLTNLDYVEFFKNDEFVGKFYPDKKPYPHLEHPPIIIDNYVSEAILRDERFRLRHRKKIRTVLAYASLHGLNRLKLRHYFTIGWLMFRYRLKFQDLFDLWGAHISGWGKGRTIYKFVGYRDGKVVLTKEKGPKNHFSLKAEVLTSSFKRKDTLIVKVALVDEFGDRALYSAEALLVTVNEGWSLERKSPLSLHAGGTTLYLRQTDKKQEDYQINISSPYYGEITLKGKI
ncbi:MAG: glycoside hydrolase family 2 protein [Bacilli bacterium]